MADEPVKQRKSNLPPGPGPGRPLGSVNKTTALLKDAILQAAQAAGGGDEDGIATYLTQQARDNPGPFMSLLGKVLPMQITGINGGPLETVTRVEIVSPVHVNSAH